MALASVCLPGQTETAPAPHFPAHNYRVVGTKTSKGGANSKQRMECPGEGGSTSDKNERVIFDLDKTYTISPRGKNVKRYNKYESDRLFGQKQNVRSLNTVGGRGEGAGRRKSTHKQYETRENALQETSEMLPQSSCNLSGILHHL